MAFAAALVVPFVLLAVYWSKTRDERRVLAVAASILSLEIGALYASWEIGIPYVPLLGGPSNALIIIGIETLMGGSAYFLSFSAVGRKVSMVLGSVLVLFSLTVGLASMFGFAVPGAIMIMAGVDT